MAQPGSALPWGGRGRGFESRRSDYDDYRGSAGSEKESADSLIRGAGRLMSYYMYMLSSLKASWHYTGSSDDVPERLKAHNSGKVKSTRPWRPFKLIYTEEYATRSEAFRREMYLKSIDGVDEKRRIIKEYDR